MSAHTFSFYCPPLEPADAVVTLDADEHHHLSRVLRMKRGDSIRVTNGRGLIVSAEIESVEASRTTARVSNAENRPRPVPLVLAPGLLPREPMETALAQCIEAGITGWVPVIAERCHVRRATDRHHTRWARIAVAAIKQSGRAWLPAIEAPVDAGELVSRFASFERVVLAEAGAPEPVEVTGQSASTLAIVGPEAGLTDAEQALFVGAGARPVRLSAQRLRAETAAVALTSMLALGRGPV